MRTFQAVAFLIAVAAPVAPAGAAMLTPSLCAALVAAASTVVEAAYVPGVTARGERVVPAELPGHNPPPPLPSSATLTTSIGDADDETALRRRPIEGDLPVADVLVDADGKARFAGAPDIENGERSALQVCKNRFG